MQQVRFGIMKYKKLFSNILNQSFSKMGIGNNSGLYLLYDLLKATLLV